MKKKKTKKPREKFEKWIKSLKKRSSFSFCEVKRLRHLVPGSSSTLIHELCLFFSFLLPFPFFLSYSSHSHSYVNIPVYFFLPGLPLQSSILCVRARRRFVNKVTLYSHSRGMLHGCMRASRNFLGFKRASDW